MMAKKIKKLTKEADGGELKDSPRLHFCSKKLGYYCTGKKTKAPCDCGERCSRKCKGCFDCRCWQEELDAGHDCKFCGHHCDCGEDSIWCEGCYDCNEPPDYD